MDYFIAFFFLSIVSTRLSHAALLSANLRTFQAHACDGETLVLTCLPGTFISIFLANYGSIYGASDANDAASPCLKPPTPSASSYSGSEKSEPYVGPAARLRRREAPSYPARFSSSHSSLPTDMSISATATDRSSSSAPLVVETNRQTENHKHQLKSIPLKKVVQRAARRQVPSHLSLTSINQTSQSLSPKNHHDCQNSESLRYSLLTKVEAACRQKRHCSILTDPKSFGGIDPCPGMKKYAEVAYKCRPSIFTNKVVCEDDKLRLTCKGGFRLAIHSAFFGSTKKGVPECPQNLPESQLPHPSLINDSLSSSSPDAFHNHVALDVQDYEECSSSYISEKVISRCSGLQTCEIEASRELFGKVACKKQTRLHLKVAYQCIPEAALRDLSKSSTRSPASASEKRSESDHKVTSSTVDYSGYMEAPRIVSEPEVGPSEGSPSQGSSPHTSANNIEARWAESGMKPASSSASNESSSKSYVKTSELNGLKNNGFKEKKESLLVKQQIESDPYRHNSSQVIHSKKSLVLMVDWLSAYKFIREKSEVLILCLLVTICGVLLLFFLFITGNMLSSRKKAKSGHDRHDGVNKCKNSAKSTPINGQCDRSSGLCDGSETIVDSLLDDLDPILLGSSTDPISKLSLGSYHSFHDFRANPRSSSGETTTLNCSHLSPLHTINYNSTLTRSPSRYSSHNHNHTHNHRNHSTIDEADCLSQTMAGTLNSYF